MEKSATSLDIDKDKPQTIIDELELIEDENEKFWKTPSSSRMVRGGTIMMVADIIGSLFFTAYMMVLGRAPTSDSSLLAVIDTLGIMLRFFAYLGFTAAGSKFMAEYLTRDKEQARIYAKSAAKYNMWVTGFPLIAISIWLYLTQPKNDIERVAYFCLIIIITFDRLTSCVSIYIIGGQRYDLFTIAYFIPFAGMYLFGLITYLEFGVVGPLITFAVARVVMFILMVLMMRKATDFPLSDLFDWSKDYGLFWKMFSFNFLYSLANLAFALLTSTLLISGGKLLGILTPQEIVAIYTISTFSNILMNIFGIVGPIMVSVSESHALKNKKLVQNYTMIAVKFPLVMTVAVLMFFIMFGPEMIEIFYGSRWITMGMLIMICLMPAYTTGSFASKYDNILAGIGRPETVVIPWFFSLTIAIVGLFLGILLPDNYYLINDFIDYKGAVLNYGISLRFAFTLGMNALALFIGGIWIVKICLRVLNTKIPRPYFWKPILVAALTGLAIQIFLWIVPFRDITLQWSTSIGNILGLSGSWDAQTIAGIIFTIVMVLSGGIIYLSLGILFDMMNKEDGKFWKSIIVGLGPLQFFLKPLLKWSKFLLKHQIKLFVHPPQEWVLKTDKETLLKEAQFKVEIIPETKAIGKTEKGVLVDKSETLKFKIIIKDLKVNLYDIITYLKIDGVKKIETLSYCSSIEPNIKENNTDIKKDEKNSKENKINNEFTNNQKIVKTLKVDYQIPQDFKKGIHEILVILEAYERSRPEITKEQLFNKGWWAYWDYRLRWIHEEEFFIDIA